MDQAEQSVWLFLAPENANSICPSPTLNCASSGFVERFSEYQGEKYLSDCYNYKQAGAKILRCAKPIRLTLTLRAGGDWPIKNLELNVGLTSNQAVNLSFSIV